MGERPATVSARCKRLPSPINSYSLTPIQSEYQTHQQGSLKTRETSVAGRKLLKADRGGIQYVEHAEGHGDRLFDAACKVGLEGIVSKKLDVPYRSGKSKAWIKVKNPKAPAATRAIDGTF